MRVWALGLGVLLSVVVLAAPLGAEAQESRAGRVPRVGVLAPGRPPNVAVEAFRSGLRDLGYVEDQNIVLEWRWDEDKPERYAALAGDLLQLNVDLMVAGTTVASIAAKNATKTTPIVMAATGLGDPVELGLIRSFARPGGNVTGLVLRTNELPGKRLELLKETVPGLARVALLWNWGGKTYYSQTRLDALPAESAGKLLEALLGEDLGLAALKQLLVKRGNSFFLERD